MLRKVINKLTQNKYYLIGAISILLLLIISLGTAALRSTLSLVGTTRINENSWILYFDHVHDEQFPDNITPDRKAIIVDQAKTRIEFTIDLKPGEEYQYTVDMINDGSQAAMIDAVRKTELTGDQLKYLEFDIFYTSGLGMGNQPKRCDTIPPNHGVRNITVLVRYKDGLDANEYPTDDLHLNLFFEMDYRTDLQCSTEETPYTLTLDPDGGKLDDSNSGKTYATSFPLLKNSTQYSDSMTVKDPTRPLYNFKGWQVVEPLEDGTYQFNENSGYFKIGNENVTLKALWEEGNYVARIENVYYTTIQAAFDAAQLNRWQDAVPTVWLLKDTTEYPTNNTTKPFIFNLDSHTVTGTITNSSNGNITLLNGKVRADENDDEAFINHGTLNLGQDDGVVNVENSIALIGHKVGLINYASQDSQGHENGSIFNFYDGYIEGETAISRGYLGHPNHYVVFVNHIDDKQRAYLVNDTTRAVAKTTTMGEIFYYVLQDAIDDVIENKNVFSDLTDNDYVIEAIRDFEAAYPLSVSENSRIFFDTKGYRIWTGETITNDGYFEIKNSKNNNKSIINTSKTIINNGEMKLNNLKLNAETETYIVTNKGNLDLSDTELHGQHTYAITNEENGEITFNQNTFIDSVETNSFYNSSPELTIDNGTIYGLYNEANGMTITGDANFEIYHWRTYTYTFFDHYIPAITNVGTINFTGGTVTNDEHDTCMMNNSGTMNISDGTFNSLNRVVCNSYNSNGGTLNITGGNIHGEGTTITDGTVNISNNAEISCDNGTTIHRATINLDTGKIYTQSGYTISESSVTLVNGEIYTESGTTIYNSTVEVQGGSVYSSDATAIKSSNVTISGGSITGVTYGIEDGGNVVVTGGTITSDEKAVTCNNIDISGGTITSPNDAVTTNDLNITAGTVESTNYNAITVNREGTILDGNIHGGLYGVLNNGKLTIGTDEGEISQSIPTIIGDSVGLYITGTDTAFFDGILKGQIDGYVGEITQTPLGGKTIDSTETIDDVLYQTDYIISYQPWLEIEGKGQYNTINAASQAIGDGETATIKVIEDVTPSFVQHFIDENHNKKITFDLNGHIIKSTQVAYNNDSDVTVIDSVGTGKMIVNNNYYFENDNKMTVSNITIQANGDVAGIRNQRHGTLTYNGTNITAKKCGIQGFGYTALNDITINSQDTGACVEMYDGLYEHYYGSVEMNSGSITATNDGVNIGYGGGFVLNDGTVSAGRYGTKGISTTVNGGSIHSTDVAIYGGNSTVNDGTVKSDTNYGIYSDSKTTVNGGYVEGTTGIAQYPYFDLYSRPQYSAIDVNGGTVVGKTSHGIVLTGSYLTVTGGEIYGEVDGILNNSHTTIGNNEGTISITSPLVQGKHNGLTTNGIFYFYDGILKGKNLARDGQVNLVPDAAMIKDDYEYIDRVEYKTEYLEAYGNWLRVGEQEFNSLYAAQNVIDDYGTVYVIKDVNINFEQSLVGGKHVTLDLNGHQVMMMKTLTTNGINTITDSSESQRGLLSNISDVESLSALTNKGNLTITGGNYQSNNSYAIANEGTMTIDGLEMSHNGVISSSGNLTVNSGKLESTGDRPTIEVRGTTTINGGTISSDYGVAINVSAGPIDIAGGDIISTVSNAVAVSAYNTSNTISGGNITGYLNGVTSGSDRNSFYITGGHIVGETECGVYSTNPYTYVTGGTLEGATYGLDVPNGATIGTDDGTVVIDTPIIKGELYGLNITNGTLNFNDGILKGIDGSEQGIITNIPAGTQEYPDSETIDSKSYHTKYLIQEKDLAYNVQLDKYYNNLQTAFNEAQENNTIQLLTNIPIYYPVTNNNSNPFTLDLMGFSISTNKPITNNGTLTITEGDGKTGKITTSSSINLITNNGDLTISNIKLVNNSSSNYIITSYDKLNANNAEIEGINGINTSSFVTLNDTDITVSDSAVVTSGVLSLTGGTIVADNYAVYTNGYNTSTIEDATITGRMYNTRGTNVIKNTTINLNSHYNGYNTITQSIDNSGTMQLLNNTKVLGQGYISNSGTMEINHITVDINGDRVGNYPYAGIYNSGTLTIDNATITVEKEKYQSTTRGISNTGTITMNSNVTLEVGDNTSGGYEYNMGIYESGNGSVTIDGATINVHGKDTSYGIYLDGSNTNATIVTGNINVTKTKYAYDAFVTTGTFTMGHKDNVQDASDLVSQTDPRLYASGDIKGIGVKKSSGNFNFYDGIIWASTYARQGTTSNVENLYEVTTYVDEETTFEKALLEFMGSDYDQTIVAMIGLQSCYSLQSCIDLYEYTVQPGQTEPTEVITLVRSVEEPIQIESGKHVVIDLHGMSLTTSIDINNDAVLQLYNGTIIEVSDEDNPENNDYINNYGTLILGKDDGNVSSSSIRVISENTAINNVYEDQYVHTEGRLEMYDGYIEGNPAINGQIDKIAEFARLYTKTDAQYERIYLQSLSREAIENRETALIVNIDPNGGTFKNSTNKITDYLYFGDEYELNPNPTKHACVFAGWEINDETAISQVDNYYKITIGYKDLELKAKWEIDPNAVARIGEDYYFSLVEAIAASKSGDVIEVLKDITLDDNTNITNNKEIVIDLGTHTLAGNIANEGLIYNHGILFVVSLYVLGHGG